MKITERRTRWNANLCSLSPCGMAGAKPTKLAATVGVVGFFFLALNWNFFLVSRFHQDDFVRLRRPNGRATITAVVPTSVSAFNFSSTSKYVESCLLSERDLWYDNLKYPPRILSSSRTTQTYHNLSADIVMGLATGYSLSKLRPLVLSMRMAKMDCQVIIVTHDFEESQPGAVDPDLESFFIQMGVTHVHYGRLDIRRLAKYHIPGLSEVDTYQFFQRIPLAIFRRYLYLDYLRRIARSSSKLPWVFLVDTKDTWFQYDVFSHPSILTVDLKESQPLYIYLEGQPFPMPLRARRWSRNGISRCFGPDHSLLSKFSTSAGTVIGTIAAVEVYLVTFLNQVSTMGKHGEWGWNPFCRDQVLHNYLVESGKLTSLNVKKYSNINGMIGNLGLYGCAFQTDSQHHILNDNGAPFAAVHTYYLLNQHICLQQLSPELETPSSIPVLPAVEKQQATHCEKLFERRWDIPRLYGSTLGFTLHDDRILSSRMQSASEPTRHLIIAAVESWEPRKLKPFLWSLRSVCNTCRVVLLFFEYHTGRRDLPLSVIKLLNQTWTEYEFYDRKLMFRLILDELHSENRKSAHKILSGSTSLCIVKTTVLLNFLSKLSVHLPSEPSVFLLHVEDIWFQSNPFLEFGTSLGPDELIFFHAGLENQTYSKVASKRQKCLREGKPNGIVESSDGIILGSLRSTLIYLKVSLEVAFEFHRSLSQTECSSTLLQTDEMGAIIHNFVVQNRLQSFTKTISVQDYSSTVAATVGTLACMFKVEKGKVVNINRQPIAMLHEYWFFLPQACSQQFGNLHWNKSAPL